MKALADKVHKQRAQSPTLYYISHNHSYISSSDTLVGTISSNLCRDGCMKCSNVGDCCHPVPPSSHPYILLNFVYKSSEILSFVFCIFSWSLIIPNEAEEPAKQVIKTFQGNEQYVGMKMVKKGQDDYFNQQSILFTLPANTRSSDNQ